MGNSTSNKKNQCFSNSELDKIKECYKSNFSNEKNLNSQLNILTKELFRDLTQKHQIDISKYLSKCFQIIFKKSFGKFDYNSFVLFSEFLLKSNNSEDAFLSSYYQNISYIYILYDIIKGDPGAFRNGVLDSDLILDIFDFAIDLHINLHDGTLIEAVKNRYKFENMHKYIKVLFSNLNLINEENNYDRIIFDAFISEYLLGFDCLIRDYFTNLILENNKSNIYYNNSLPTYQFGISNMLTTEQFFIFCMANPFISNKKHAYKLYCCNQSGFNISSVIYSFLGFDGPITIFIKHINKDQSSSIIGIFLNSNFKECFENYVGDESCFTFTIHPYIKFYRTDPYSSQRNKILYLSSKNHKNTDMKPGIGLGYSYFGSKIWLDLNEPFKKSYFNKKDSVFQEGSPFEDEKEILNISNIEVFAFGDEDNYKSLQKKLGRDQIICQKMRQVDKARFIETDFDKEMFFKDKFTSGSNIDHV